MIFIFGYIVFRFIVTDSLLFLIPVLYLYILYQYSELDIYHHTWGVWHPWMKIIGDVHSVISKKNKKGLSDTFLLKPHTWPAESDGDVRTCWSLFWYTEKNNKSRRYCYIIVIVYFFYDYLTTRVWRLYCVTSRYKINGHKIFIVGR